MPSTEANPQLTTARCPLCDTPLDPVHPNECPKCDWVAGQKHPDDGVSFRDKAAVFLSVVPGLGHIYKGQRLLGALLMLGSVFAGFASLLAGFASAGWGTLLLPLYWIGVMMHAFWADDLVAQQHAKTKKG
jgi:hypothetical protein